MIKTFEQLRSHIWDERQFVLGHMADCLKESTEFERGKWSGEIDAYNCVLDLLRTSLKYGEPEELE